MVEIPEYEVRTYRPGDEEAILETFNRCFADVDPGFEPRTLEYWRWQYLENPSGWRIYIAVTPEGEVISQCAGVPQRVRFDGQEVNFSQMVDSMTDPAYRKGLKKPGIFVITATPYWQNYGGAGEGRDHFHYGAPVPAAWRIGKTYLGYELIRTQYKLCVSPAAMIERAAPGIEVEETRVFPDEVDALFERCALDYRVIAVRDRARLAWRFEDHPNLTYDIALARRGGELVGLTVYRQGDFSDAEEQGLVCDWLVPSSEEATVGSALRAWLARRARTDGARCLTTMFADTSRPWLAFQDAGFRAERSRYFVVGRSYVKPYDMRYLYDHWYYTLGDTDLV